MIKTFLHIISLNHHHLVGTEYQGYWWDKREWRWCVIWGVFLALRQLGTRISG